MNEKTLLLIKYHFTMSLIILSILLTPFFAYTGTLFVCVDKEGNETITDSPLDQITCKQIGASKEMTAQEKMDYENERKEKEKNREIEYQKNKADEEAKSKLSECLNRAKERYEENWGGSCRFLNRPNQCDLPDEMAKRWNDIHNEERNECFARYPQIQ